ncbi:hypothetical protein [Serratia sp. CY76391]|uniref:hypothetical protein n=1 Tax=Serratia sp. CY76391 TaxID=3383681 RepID=UPI003F9F6F12
MGNYFSKLRLLHVLRWILGVPLIFASLGCWADTSYKVTFYNTTSVPVVLSGPQAIHDKKGIPWGDLSTCMVDWNLPMDATTIQPYGGLYSFVIRDKNGIFACDNSNKWDTWYLDVPARNGMVAATLLVRWRHGRTDVFEHDGWTSDVTVKPTSWSDDASQPNYSLQDYISYVHDGHGQNMFNKYVPDKGPPEEVNVYIGKLGN